MRMITHRLLIAVTGSIAVAAVVINASEAEQQDSDARATPAGLRWRDASLWTGDMPAFLWRFYVQGLDDLVTLVDRWTSWTYGHLSIRLDVGPAEQLLGTDRARRWRVAWDGLFETAIRLDWLRAFYEQMIVERPSDKASLIDEFNAATCIELTRRELIEPSVGYVFCDPGSAISADRVLEAHVDFRPDMLRAWRAEMVALLLQRLETWRNVRRVSAAVPADRSALDALELSRLEQRVEEVTLRMLRLDQRIAKHNEQLARVFVDSVATGRPTRDQARAMAALARHGIAVDAYQAIDTAGVDIGTRDAMLRLDDALKATRTPKWRRVYAKRFAHRIVNGRMTADDDALVASIRQARWRADEVERVQAADGDDANIEAVDAFDTQHQAALRERVMWAIDGVLRVSPDREIIECIAQQADVKATHVQRIFEDDAARRSELRESLVGDVGRGWTTTELDAPTQAAVLRSALDERNAIDITLREHLCALNEQRSQRIAIIVDAMLIDRLRGVTGWWFSGGRAERIVVRPLHWALIQGRLDELLWEQLRGIVTRLSSLGRQIEQDFLASLDTSLQSAREAFQPDVTEQLLVALTQTINDGRAQQGRWVLVWCDRQWSIVGELARLMTEESASELRDLVLVDVCPELNQPTPIDLLITSAQATGLDGDDNWRPMIAELRQRAPALNALERSLAERRLELDRQPVADNSARVWKSIPGRSRGEALLR